MYNTRPRLMIKHPREKSVCYTQLNAIFYMDLFLILYIDDFVCAWYNRPVMTKSTKVPQVFLLLIMRYGLNTQLIYFFLH